MRIESERSHLVFLAWFGLLLLGAVPGVWGQERPVATAVRVATAPVVDGALADDEAWTAATAVTDFWQTTPDEGEPSTERTEIRVVYTDEALYFGVLCHDSDPASIVVSDSRRDASLTETDSFQVVLDTFRDSQTGFLFGTNPAGVEYDAQVTPVGSGAFGSSGGVNENWDGAWRVEARTTDDGWSAEIEIPFRPLRFPRGSEQIWGINFQRNIRRRNENAFWAPLPRQHDLTRLALVGTLEGLEVPSQRNLKLIPYVLGEAVRAGVEGTERTTDEEFGLDLKYSVTPSLTLDASYNTDFAQVEADEQQINLDRFNLFFPEKRPFFLENAGNFAVGVPGEVELFFSRRIGIGPGGNQIPIDGGLRLSGKAGQAWNLGLLYMRAEWVAGVAPENDFAVARVSHDFPNRSYLGAIFVGREGSGPFALGDDTNRTFGVDGRLGIGANGEIEGFVAQTDTPGIESDDHAFRLGGRYTAEKWQFSGGYTEVADHFNPEVGFLQRNGYRKPDFFVLRRIRPKQLWGLHELRPHVSYRGFWDFDGFQETGFLHVDNHWEWKNGHEIHTGVNFTREGVKEAFEIFPGVVVPPGTYEHSEGQIVFFTNRGAAVGVEGRITAGGFFGGDRFAVSPTLRFRLGETFSTRLDWSHNDIDLPGGSFETNLARLRLSYSFTPRISLEGLVQYNDRADVQAANLRFAWLQNANTGLFIVYNERRDVGSAGTGVPGRSLIVKYSRLIDLL